MSAPRFAHVRAFYHPPLHAPDVPYPGRGAAGGTGWLHEIKHDGYRTQIIIEGGKARAYSRNGLNWSGEYGPIVDAARVLGCDAATSTARWRYRTSAAFQTSVRSAER